MKASDRGSPGTASGVERFADGDIDLDCFAIKNRNIGPNYPCLIVAEMGLGHDGSLGMAHAFIDAAAEADADAVKFQTHIADAESTPAEAFRVKVFPQDATRQDYWRRTAFTEAQWMELRQHADARDVLFLSSAFSTEAVDLLHRVGIPAWKVASGETSNTPMLRKMAETGLPILLSTGMSGTEEIDDAVSLIKSMHVPLAVYQCTNRYPCPAEHVGLNMIPEFQSRYRVPIGFSDHSGRSACALAALSAGACSIEVHVVFSRKCFGPDVGASLTFEELGQLVNDVRFVETALASPVDKTDEAEALTDVRRLFTKSIVAARNLSPGHTLTMADLAFKKPGTGVPAGRYEAVIGKTLKKRIARDEQLALEDLE